MNKPWSVRLAALLMAALLLGLPARAEDLGRAEIERVRAAFIEDFDISPRLLTQGTYSRETVWRQAGEEQVGIVSFVSEVTDHVYAAYLSLEDGQMLRAEEFYNAGDVCVTRTLMDLEAPPRAAYALRDEPGEAGQAIARYAAAGPASAGEEDLPRQEAERIARTYFERELGLQDSFDYQVSARLLGEGEERWWLLSLSGRGGERGAYQIAVSAGSGLVLAATLTAAYLAEGQ